MNSLGSEVQAGIVERNRNPSDSGRGSWKCLVGKRRRKKLGGKKGKEINESTVCEAQNRTIKETVCFSLQSYPYVQSYRHSLKISLLILYLTLCC